MVVVHKIDQDSPLFNISAEELMKEKFEIVVILEGVIESTGATTQARSSYLPSGSLPKILLHWFYGNDNCYDSYTDKFCVRGLDCGLHIIINMILGCGCTYVRRHSVEFQPAHSLRKPAMVIIVLYHIISFLYVPLFSADSTFLMNKCNRLSLQLPRP